MQNRNGEPEVYSYDQAPRQMRHQMCVALLEGLGNFHNFSEDSFHVPPNANNWWDEIDRVCRKELYSYLDHCKTRNLAQRVLQYLEQIPGIDEFLSVVEIGCICLSAVDDSFDHTAQRGANSPF